MKNIFLISLALSLLSCNKDNDELKMLISGTNNQGLSYNKNRLFSANDIDGVNNRIIVYDYETMGIIKDNTILALGHGAGMEFSDKENLLYVTNGIQGVLSHVYTIDIQSEKPTIQRDYNLENLGDSACISLDDENNIFYIISSFSGNQVYQL